MYITDIYKIKPNNKRKISANNSLLTDLEHTLYRMMGDQG